MLASLLKLQQSRRVSALSGLTEWLLAYIFGSLAIDRGGIGWYILATLFFIAGINSFMSVIKPDERN